MCKLTLFCKIFLPIFSILGLYMSGADVMVAMQSKSWPTYEGVVISSKLKEVDRGSGSSSNITQVIINYQYDVEGETISSDRIGIGSHLRIMFRNHYDLLSSIQQNFPKGKKIKVFVSPDNHRFSLLTPGFSEGLFVKLFIMICVFVISLSLWFKRKGQRGL